MANKSYLTLDDLYNYFESNSKRVRHFSSKDSGKDLVVQSHGIVKFSKSEDNSDLTKVVLQACHTQDNLNHSFISDEVMANALSSFLNKPILAYIHQVDGEPQFYDHRMHQDEDGEIVYDEYPVGVIPESGDPHLEYDEEKEKNYVVVNGYLFNEYSQASDILERDGECAVSVELNISDLSFSPKDKLMVIEAFTFSGVTILGVHPDGSEVKPGMQGSNIKLGDFSNHNSVFSNERMMTMLEELSRKVDILTNFSNKNIERKEDKVELNTELFNQLLEKYNKTEADIEFEYSKLDDDALSAAFAEAFEDKEDSSSEGDIETNSESEESVDAKSEENADEDAKFEDEDSSDSESDNNSVEANASDEATGSDDTTGSDEGVVEPAENEQTEENELEDVQTNEGDEPKSNEDSDVNTDDGSDAEQLKKKQNNEVQYSATFNGNTKTYSISLNEEIRAITELVNMTYGEEDNDWYDCEVYADHTVIMHGWFRHFKQKYTVKNENIYSLKGERVEVFAKFLTQEECDALDGLKGKFEEVSAKLAKYEAEPEKMSILESADYSSIAESEEFVAFKTQDAHFDLSVDEVRAKADEMLLNAAKQGKVDFSKKDTEKKTKIGYKLFPVNNVKKGVKKYGNLLQGI